MKMGARRFRVVNLGDRMNRNTSRVARTTTVLFAIAALALTGCVDTLNDAAPTSSPTAVSSTTPSPAPSETPTATPAAEAMTVTQLHELYIASGLTCELKLAEPSSDGELERGDCVEDEGVAFLTFTTNADVDALLHRHADSYEPGMFLVGDRWLVRSSNFADTLPQAQTTLGGKIWTSEAPFYSGE